MRDSTDEIRETLRSLARSATTPKQLLKQTLAKHSGASTKAVARAAFREMIEAADSHPEAAAALQEVGLATRNADK